jgi:hypothetical protein
MPWSPMRRQRTGSPSSSVPNSTVAWPSGEATDQVSSRMPDADRIGLTRKAAGQVQGPDAGA